MDEIKSNRAHALDTAKSLVDGDRNVDYGDPISDFQRTADYWSIHIAGVLERKLRQFKGDLTAGDILHITRHVLDPHDVAIMMMQLKQSRLAWSPYKEDHWFDSAGYAACGYDCVSREGS